MQSEHRIIIPVGHAIWVSNTDGQIKILGKTNRGYWKIKAVEKHYGMEDAKMPHDGLRLLTQGIHVGGQVSELQLK